MKNTAGFRIIKGKIPVLVSAPHAYSHRRPSYTMSYKIGEPWTDYIVENICLNTGAWGIMLTDETDYDPNYHKIGNNPYKEEIKRLLEENKIEKFVDIHGLSNEHDYDIGIYYPSKFWKSIRLAQDVAQCIDSGDLRGINTCVLRFGDNGQETLGEFVASNLRVPSIQIEVARYIRDREGLRNGLVNNLSRYLIV